MKRLSRILLFGVALLLVGCGVAEPIVEAPAAEMNLTAADLGEGFTLTTQSGLDDTLARLNVPAEDKGTIVDVDQRTFVAVNPVSTTAVTTATAPLTTTEVIAVVLVHNAAGAADAGLNELFNGFKDLVAITVTLQEQAITKMGDQTKFVTAGVTGRAAQVHLLLFRKGNVVGMVQVTGPAGIQPQWAIDLAQKMLLRIPEAASE